MEAYTLDEYARVLIGQNNNIPCPHCKSALGHYSYCGLINREAGEAHRVVATLEFNETDKIIAHGLGVQL